MAEALLRHYGAGRFEALSAGLNPTTIHPLAIQVMREIGLDISGQRAKNVKEYLGRVPFGHVIFVCDKAEANCPRLYPPNLPESWPFEDPAAATGSDEERLNKFREVRDRLAARIQAWLAEHS
jgi:arsenate reductase